MLRKTISSNLLCAAVLLLVPLLPSGASAAGFKVKGILPADAGPRSVALADLNHDGIDDIVEMVEPLTTLPDHIPLQYAVHLGQADGSFNLTNTYQPYAGVLHYRYTYSPGVDLERTASV